MSDKIELPLFRLEMEGLKQHCLHAISRTIGDYQGTLEASVKKAFDEFPFDVFVKKHVHGILEDILNEAVYEYMKRGPGADLIYNIVSKMATEAMEPISKRQEALHKASNDIKEE